MNRQVAFWDSSAIVPLCLQQLNSAQARAFATQFSLAVWWTARVEVASAFARLCRFGTLEENARDDANRRLQLLIVDWDEVPANDEIRERAAHLLDLYPLRAADSLQLAAALAWCRDQPAGHTFLCADKHLSDAAARAGFAVLSP